jgi:four helix bundle protein
MFLVTRIYKVTSDFPRNEEFGLQLQMRRAAVSVPTNISEGAGRQSKKEFVQFLYIAIGSLGELETLLLIAHNLSLFDSVITRTPPQ